MNRREHLLGLAGLVAGSALVGLPRSGAAESRTGNLPAAADSSQLIYITPIRSDGRESRCQAEVWFLREGDGLFVVTAADAWRARAIQSGLSQARIWVGDVGVWSRNEEYRDLPVLLSRGELVPDAAIHTQILAKFGKKYTAEWGTWGPRFADGLADGSRVMIRYLPV